LKPLKSLKDYLPQRLRLRLGDGFWASRTGLSILGGTLLVLIIAMSIFTYYYISFGRMIDRRLFGDIFQNTSRVYAAPQNIYKGEAYKKPDLEAYLVHAGYQEEGSADVTGVFISTGRSVEVRPGKNSYFAGGNALRIDFQGNGISKITTLPDGNTVDTAQLEPQVLTNLFDTSREKRRLVRFEDLPTQMVDAVLSAEDKRFFEHGGFDSIRVLGAAWADVRRGQRAQGASTIDMQVARSFFFTTKRVWSRKIKETLVALELDQRFTKQQIFTLYANEVYLGNRGSFAIRGFGEAAEAYFGKDIRDLSVGEDAFLAGIIRAPSRYSAAEAHPDRAVEARDRVLTQMVENGYLSAADSETAKNTKLHFVGAGVNAADGPYFVDMVKDHLLGQLSETDLSNQSYRIYTTLDPALQRAATAAVDFGAQNLDKLLARRYAAWTKKGEAAPKPQIALVALDPETGEIRALVGGRSYGESQLNHAVARRQPGSAFKPFVYAAAFNNAVAGLQPVVTPATMVVDEPTTFMFDGKDYTPNNFGQEFYGSVTARDALIHSLNVATVKIAEMVGYDRVAAVAHQMGLGNNIVGTPAMALGAYEMTPIDVAAGYTVFANNGVRAEPLFIRRVYDAQGRPVEEFEPTTRPVLDPRVAYLTTTLMEDVINRGTGASVRALGFEAPAAGKTGTSRDGWFAGFTSNLVCVVWVGFDDNRDLGLSGTVSAAPIWGEFMKHAVTLPGYRNPEQFDPPSGLVQVTVDPQSEQLATPSCPSTKQEVFIAGTEPTSYCFLHGGGRAANSATPLSWLSHIFGKGSPPPPTATPVTPENPYKSEPGAGEEKKEKGQSAQEENQQTGEKKKGVLGKIFGIFGGSKKPADQQKPNP
jgi:penicillin-binding protein 1B